MKFIEKIKDNLSPEVIIIAFICLIAGIITGFFIAPAKNGIILGSYNGCNNHIEDSNKVSNTKN